MAKANKKVDAKAYWKNAAVRAMRTALQTFLAVMIANQAGMFEADVLMAGLAAAGSALISAAQNAFEDAPFDFMSNIPKG